MRAIDADALEKILEKIPAADIKNMGGQAYVLVKLSQVFNVIDNQPTIEPRKKGKWIPCSKKLPERNRVVIVTTKWGEVTEGVKLSGNAWFIGRGEENAFDSDIIAWMPLPEPYKEGGAV